MLLEAVRTRNEELAQTWKKSEQWATIEQLCSKCPPPPATPMTRAQTSCPSGPSTSSWALETGPQMYPDGIMGSGTSTDRPLLGPTGVFITVTYVLRPHILGTQFYGFLYMIL